MKKLKRMVALCLIALQGTAVFAYDTSSEFLREKQLEFAAQYDYHEGDSDKSFAEYPEIQYTSGIEYREDGSEYECPAIYIDAHAMHFNDFHLEQKNVVFQINGSENPAYNQCVLYNDRLLVPVKVFEEVGCQVDFNEETYVATLSKDGVTLEILPNLIGMRKNQQNGFYVPLEVCARFIDDTLYVPVRATANELQLQISWDQTTRTVALNG